MRKTSQYRRRMEICDQCREGPFSELRALWQTLGDSYADLTELEAGPIGVLGMAITCAPSAGKHNGVRLRRPAYDEPALTR